MSEYVMIGKKLIPTRDIALVEPFEASANPSFQPSRNYLGRLVLLNRESHLIELTPEAFAEAHGFRLLGPEHVAFNPRQRFQVEAFAPAEGFRPARPYATRLRWRDPDGNEQSKLLLADPVMLLELLSAQSGRVRQKALARPPSGRGRTRAAARLSPLTP